MAYTDIDKPSDYFNTVTYTGTGSTRSVTGVGFQPDWLWIKSRSGAVNHALYDVNRGGTNALRSNTTGAEAQFGDAVVTFETDGFEIAGTNVTGVNGSGESIVSWNWLGGGTASENTQGDITSQVSASTTSGFSIVSYTGTGSLATVGHGLGVTPKMIIVKGRTNVNNWVIYHESIGATKYIFFDTQPAGVSSTPWNNTSPTVNSFTVNTSGVCNGSGVDYIAYCFAEKKGFSKFGTYTGNGNADGTFVYTGFKPAFVMLKRTNGTNNWLILDSIRDPFNDVEKQLLPNVSDSEYTVANTLDLTSNGFKLRDTNASRNASGGTYIYMAFASNPFVTSTGVPTTAR